MIKKTLLFCLCLLVTTPFVHAQTSTQPQPPPVDIVISAPNNPVVGTEIPITIKVKPQVDMHADISCALPLNVEPVYEKGVRIMPYHSRGIPNIKRQIQCRLSAGLWAGPLKAGETKEFTFKVKTTQKGSYLLICVVQALAKWGEKEGSLVVNVN
jgi:hypothetical protein